MLSRTKHTWVKDLISDIYNQSTLADTQLQDKRTNLGILSMGTQSEFPIGHCIQPVTRMKFN